MNKSVIGFLWLAILFSAANGAVAEKEVTLIVGGYTAPREALKKIIPLFQADWKQKSGEKVIFKESYLGSGAQSRAIAEGFEADVAILSMEPDITRLVEKGLITHDWKARAVGGMISRSVVAFAVRPGNPKKGLGWRDLAQQQIEVLTPNPKMSGGAQWNLLAAYGAALRGKVEGYEASDVGARKFLADLLRHVTVLDKGARESIINYENGNGDLAISYESEILVGREHGGEYELVVPDSNLLIENPAAVVDASVEKHGTRAVAEAFLAFLTSEPAQKIFAQSGYRPVHDGVAKEFEAKFASVKDLWSIDFLGDWKTIQTKFFSAGGLYEQVSEEVQKNRR